MASSNDPVFNSMEDYMQHCIQENDNGIGFNIEEGVKELTLSLNCICKKALHFYSPTYYMEGYLYLNNQTSSTLNIEWLSNFKSKVDYRQHKLDEETKSVSKCNSEPIHPRQDVVLDICAKVDQSKIKKGKVKQLQMVLRGECEVWRVYLTLCPINQID